MEVVIQLPEDLVKYVEFIPVESLPNVLLEVIRDGMALKDCGAGKETTGINTETMISMLSELLADSKIVRVAAGSEPDSKKEVAVSHSKEETEPCTDVQSVFVDASADSNGDDLDDFMDLMK